MINVGIHHLTLQKIRDSQALFDDTIYKEIEDTITLANDYSPLSDFYFLINKVGLQLNRIKTAHDKSDWVPVRNVLRIIANTTQLDIKSHINNVEINSMHCGCDYFEGNLRITLDSGEIIAGPYRWQWTSFNDREKHFEKFTIFPECEAHHSAKEELVTS